MFADHTDPPTTETSVFVCYPDPDPACTNTDPVVSTTDLVVTTTGEMVVADPAQPVVRTELAYTGSFETILILVAVLLICVGVTLTRKA